MLLAAAPAAAQSPGAMSLGDPLFPQIGNGGYDVAHYDIGLSYDPASNRLLPGTETRIEARSRQALSRFSLDFQRDLAITSVTVDGVPAAFSRRNAKPRLARDRKVSQPAKLVVTPAAPIPEGRDFAVAVAYDGVPSEITDIDRSIEGWVRACSAPGECDGSFTVNEPIGAQSWFPCNNYPTDKATFRIAIRAPDAFTALGTGELAERAPHLDGTTTWTWVEDDPTATYLTTGTVGRFDFQEGSMLERLTGTTLPVYTAIDPAAPEGTQTAVRRAFGRIPEMTNWTARRYGAYPFDSTGAVADWVPAVGYELENQTKPHFAGDGQGLGVPVPILEHEIAHQWAGNLVSPRTWQQIWFNEGMATFTQVFWNSTANDAKQSPREFFRAVFTSKRKHFRLAPADLGSPHRLFDPWAVYNRPGAMFEGYRQIVGSRRFFRFVRKVMDEHDYGTITERQVIVAAKGSSGLGKRDRKRLGRYFRQWLHREGRPTLTPRDF